MLKRGIINLAASYIIVDALLRNAVVWIFGLFFSVACWWLNYAVRSVVIRHIVHQVWRVSHASEPVVIRHD